MAKSQLSLNPHPGLRIHPTAMIEEGVEIGSGSSIWDNVHIRRNAKLGQGCIVGEKSYIAYDVQIGNYVKINAFVYIPTGITVEDKVMISAGTIFVNDKYPRAFDFKADAPVDSAPNEETLNTWVRLGATIGAGCTILGGLEIGRYALIGAGSVVTKSVPDHALMVGNPARQIGWVCVCGHKLALKKGGSDCGCCGAHYQVLRGKLLAESSKARRSR